MTTVQAEKIARRKLSLLELAQELGNVSKACRIAGYSRQQFYEIRRNFQMYGGRGAPGPHARGSRAAPEPGRLGGGGGDPGPRPAHPTHGAQRVADELMLRGVAGELGGVRGVWIRHGLKRRHERLLRLEKTVRERDSS